MGTEKICWLEDYEDGAPKSTTTTKPSKKVAKADKKTVKKAKVSSTKSKVKIPKKSLTHGDISDAIFRFMCKGHAVGKREWTCNELLNAVNTWNSKVTPADHQKILLVLMKDKGLAIKCSKATIKMSPKGLAKIPPETQPKTMEEFREGVLKYIENSVPNGSTKVREVWNILKDRMPHYIGDLASKIGYKGKSLKNTRILNIMETLNILTYNRTTQRVRMTRKAFPIKFISTTIKHDLIISQKEPLGEEELTEAFL